MGENLKIESIAILVRLSDGTVKQVFLSAKDKITWIETIKNFYHPEPLKLVDRNLEIEIN
jgi:hypothetical protein